jgi:hypothetical protein
VWVRDEGGWYSKNIKVVWARDEGGWNYKNMKVWVRDR